MATLFDDFICEDDPDGVLVAAALAGDAAALSSLLERHQQWLLGLALCYTRRFEDAEDSVQDILMKVAKRIGKFKRRGQFKSWLRRFAINHLINRSLSSEQKAPHVFSSLIGSERGKIDPIDHRTIPMDLPLLIEEARSRLLLGMLLCLDHRQRTAILVSDFLELNDQVGASMLGMVESSYRALLSHARKELQYFLRGECGLLSAGKPCRCARKSASYVRSGYVDPSTKTFYKGHVDTLKSFVDSDLQKLERLLCSGCMRCISRQELPETLSLAQLLSNRHQK